MQERVVLYSYAMSPFAAKVHAFLLYKKLDFELVYVNPFKARQLLPVGYQVPVLIIGYESRNDSTPIGLWLDEKFPDKPLLPNDYDERQRLLKLNEWVTEHLIPGSFRFYPGNGLNRILNSWKLANVMKETSGLPFGVRWFWPLVTTFAGFARRLRKQAKKDKTQLYKEFIEKLAEGPFLGGREEPSFVDLAAYPQFSLYEQTGFRGSEDIQDYPKILSWMKKMEDKVENIKEILPEKVKVK